MPTVTVVLWQEGFRFRFLAGSPETLILRLQGVRKHWHQSG